MRICVFVKQVPAGCRVTTGIHNTLVREGIPHMMNPADLNALEEALRIKDDTNGHVTVCTMGPASSRDILRQAAAMGADRLCLVSDPALAGSDTYATAKTLSHAVRHLGDFDLYLCGRRSIDGETGQVGPELAVFLNIHCATNCVSLQVQGNTVSCRRKLENAYEEWRFSLPALVTVYNSVNSPRLPSIMGLRRSKDMPIETVTAAMLGLSADECGLRGSPTRVHHIAQKQFAKRVPLRAMGADGIVTCAEMIRAARDGGCDDGR